MVGLSGAGLWAGITHPEGNLMSKLKLLLGAACALSVIAFPAAAQSVSNPAQTTTGLYLRGDLAWSMSTNANIHDRNAADGVILGPGGVPGTLSDIGSGWAVGGGVGMGFIP